MKITWLGHSAFLIHCNEKKILIDPFIHGNNPFLLQHKKEVENPDYILVTHGHGDHMGDTLRLFHPECTKVISNFEICSWLKSKGISNCIDMNIGGTHVEDNISFSMVQAIHSSSIDDEGQIIYGGLAAGFVINDGSKSVYHFGDTDIFSDMSLIQKIYSPEIGLIPIGGRYTMSPKSAAIACNDYFSFETIIPMHYGTFPAIDTGTMDFVNMVHKKDSVCCLKPGESTYCFPSIK